MILGGGEIPTQILVHVVIYFKILTVNKDNNPKARAKVLESLEFFVLGNENSVRYFKIPRIDLFHFLVWIISPPSGDGWMMGAVGGGLTQTWKGGESPKETLRVLPYFKHYNFK